MCEYDASEDISIIENGGCLGTSYTREEGADEDVETAKADLEENGYHQDLSGRWSAILYYFL